MDAAYKATLETYKELSAKSAFVLIAAKPVTIGGKTLKAEG